MEKNAEQSRVALMGIIVEDTETAARINGLLHEYSDYIVGRMGIPYREKEMNIISIVLDAPQSVISALSGKLGMIPGVSSKCLYGKNWNNYVPGIIAFKKNVDYCKEDMAEALNNR